MNLFFSCFPKINDIGKNAALSFGQSVDMSTSQESILTSHFVLNQYARPNEERFFKIHVLFLG